MKSKQEHEIKIIIDLVKKYYGYDFSGYSRSSIARRVEHLSMINGFSHYSEMIPLILYDKMFIHSFLKEMSITVTEMFRDPEIFNDIREKVLPLLHIFPKIKIWHAGCATGQEVYSLAIFLQEEGLLKYTQIYATDFNSNALANAEKGIYSIKHEKKYSENYIQAGGKKKLEDYYHIKYDALKFNQNLREHIVFSNHNLTEDNVFGEMHLIMCRNVLIYFNQSLQNRVLSLFKESLAPRAFLILGDKESIFNSSVQNDFEEIIQESKIYRLNQ